MRRRDSKGNLDDACVWYDSKSSMTLIKAPKLVILVIVSYSLPASIIASIEVLIFNEFVSRLKIKER